MREKEESTMNSGMTGKMVLPPMEVRHVDQEEGQFEASMGQTGGSI